MPLKVVPAEQESLQQLWLWAGQAARMLLAAGMAFDMRTAAFLSNLLGGEFRSETSCIDGVMFPADSFAVCTAASRAALDKHMQIIVEISFYFLLREFFLGCCQIRSAQLAAFCKFEIGSRN